MEETVPFDPADYAVVVKNRGRPPKPWKWEIYRAGQRRPVEQSSDYFETMGAASREGKAALQHFLSKRAA